MFVCNVSYRASKREYNRHLSRYRISREWHKSGLSADSLTFLTPQSSHCPLPSVDTCNCWTHKQLLYIMLSIWAYAYLGWHFLKASEWAKGDVTDARAHHWSALTCTCGGGIKFILMFSINHFMTRPVLISVTCPFTVWMVGVLGKPDSKKNVIDLPKVNIGDELLDAKRLFGKYVLLF